MDQFEKIIDKYGPSFMSNIAAPVWEAAVRQAYVVGLVGVAVVLTLLVAFVVVGTVFVRAMFRIARECNDEYESDKCNHHYGCGHDNGSDYEAAAWGGGVVTAMLAAVLFAFALPHFAITLLNPQYAALKNLGALLK